MAFRTTFLVNVRRFSTSSIRAKLVNPPIQVFGIDGRYAIALYSAASKQNALPAVEKELKVFQGLLKKDVKLAEFIANPTIQKQTKRDVFATIVKKHSSSPLVANLFTALTDNGRLKNIPGVLSAFDRIMSAHRGEVVCQITTAKALDDAQLKELRAALDGFVKKGEVIHLETKVDPTIIGGMVVNIGDRYVDMSMATKIKKYSSLLQEVI